MLRNILLASLTALSAYTGLRAQTFGAPEWSNVPFTDKGKVPWAVYGPYCAGGASFALASMVAMQEDYVGYIWPQGGPVVRKTVEFPHQKGHFSFSGFCVIGGKPCVLYSLWDKKTDEVSVFLQAYSASSFDPDGTPMKICALPFAKSYDGSMVIFTILPSPDGSKMLFLYDNIQQGGFKLALCWAIDSEMSPLWSGQYRIPMQAYGSSANSFFLDNGHLYMSVDGVALTADNVKEKDDGSLKAKTDAKYWKHSDMKWYDMHGEAFREWDCSVPGMPGAFRGSPVMADDQVVMAGLMTQEEGATYVLLKMNDAFAPEVIKSGNSTSWAGLAVRSTTNKAGDIFISDDVGQGVQVMKLNNAGDVQWERTKADRSLRANAVGDQLFFVSIATKSSLKDINDGKVPDLMLSGKPFPIISAFDADGNSKVDRAFSEDARVKSAAYMNLAVDHCGCYTAVSEDKQHPGLARVCLEK